MSRDWTPREWDMIHESDPKFRDMTRNMVWHLEDGTEVPMVSEEEWAEYDQYPKLSLIGMNLLADCYNHGIFKTDKGKAVVKRMEDILNGAEDNTTFAENVRLWYDGELMPGHYMDENNNAMFEAIKGEL